MITNLPYIHLLPVVIFVEILVGEREREKKKRQY